MHSYSIRNSQSITINTKLIRRRFFRQRAPRGPRTRVNEYIRAYQVRLIDEDGKQVGIVSSREALQLAREKDLDLVEIVPKAKPPVCKIMDFGKYQYQKSKEAQQQKAKQKKTEVKGIRIGIKTDDNDLAIRRKQAEKFLSKGNKVKIEIILKGREKAHKDLAKEALSNFARSVSVSYKVEEEIKKHPRGFNMVIAPA